jgi:hypothetical protein
MVARFFPDLTPQTLAAREAQFRSYRDWERCHREDLGPSETLAAIGAWLDLLPESARARAVSTEGVEALHRALIVLR